MISSYFSPWESHVTPVRVRGGVRMLQWKPHGGWRELHWTGGEREREREREKPTWATESEEEEQESSCSKDLQNQKWGRIQDKGLQQSQNQDRRPGAVQSTMSEPIRRKSSSRQLLQNLIRWETNDFLHVTVTSCFSLLVTAGSNLVLCLVEFGISVFRNGAEIIMQLITLTQVLLFSTDLPYLPIHPSIHP